MIMTTIRTLAIALLSVTGFFGTTASLQAADVVSGIIRNDTKATFNYQAKLNNGNWVTYSIAPGQTHVFSFPYGQHQGKTIHIRYDSIVNDGRTTLTTTTLAMHGCKHPNQGWVQRFIITNSGKNLYLAR